MLSTAYLFIVCQQPIHTHTHCPRHCVRGATVTFAPPQFSSSYGVCERCVAHVNTFVPDVGLFVKTVVFLHPLDNIIFFEQAHLTGFLAGLVEMALFNDFPGYFWIIL